VKPLSQKRTRRPAALKGRGYDRRNNVLLFDERLAPTTYSGRTADGPHYIAKKGRFQEKFERPFVQRRSLTAWAI